MSVRPRPDWRQVPPPLGVTSAWSLSTGSKMFAFVVLHGGTYYFGLGFDGLGFTGALPPKVGASDYTSTLERAQELAEAKLRGEVATVVQFAADRWDMVGPEGV